MNNENKPTPHPHAELVHAWADGAKIQVKKDNGEWEECDFPLWNEKIEYHIKPSNAWSPKTDEKYFYLDVFHGEFCVVDSTWNSTDTDYALRRNNNIFPTEEEAEAAIPRVKAVLKNLYAISDKEAHDLECELYDKIDRLTKYPEIDGKPLSDGEKALIQALRDCDGIETVFEPSKTMIISAKENQIMANFYHISFIPNGRYTNDVAIVKALNQIKAEQEA